MEGPSHHGTSNLHPWDRQLLRDSVFSVLAPADWDFEQNQPERLTSTLFHYQRRALSWMLWREGHVSATPAGKPLTRFAKTQQHAPQVLVGDDLPSIGLSNSGDLPSVSGGLLADEMGLGKTVVSIALMLATQQLRQESVTSPATNAVPQCLRGGTLVVCPPTLLQQWVAELSNHAGDALIVEVYDGLTNAVNKRQAMLDEEYRKEHGDGAKKRKPDSELFKHFRKDQYTLSMVREAELYARMMAGDAAPRADSHDVAREVADRLAAADVVLTSFDVLQREVYYDSTSLQRSLRKPKRYKTADSPLIQLDWQRLMLDEAQMVGPFSNAGLMVSRIQTAHRWCVTGTPMNSDKELSDLQGLLTILDHPIFGANRDDSRAYNPWTTSVVRPLALARDQGCDSELLDSAKRAWEILCATWRPLGWRNSKAIVHAELTLPARTMHPIPLNFQSAEQQFYDKVKEKLKKTQVDLDQARASEASAKKKPEIVETASTSPRKKRRRPSAAVVLEQETRNRLTELRLACIHPQLTEYWRHMGGELRLVDGLSSMEEVLRRLVDHEQTKLQEAERMLCSNLDTLAMVLLNGATDTPDVRQKLHQIMNSSAFASSLTSPASKKPRPSASLSQTTVEEAISLLEMSFKCSEKGINAMDVPMEELEHQQEPTGVNNASWLAWKRVQINVAYQLAAAYILAGRPTSMVEKMIHNFEKRSNELHEVIDKEVDEAQKGVDQAWEKAKTLRQELVEHFTAGKDLGFPTDWSEEQMASPETWLEKLDNLYQEAQAVEQEELQRNNKSGAMLGKEVRRRLETLEKDIQPSFTRLDNWVTARRIEVDVEKIKRDLGALDNVSLQDPIVAQLRWRLYQLTDLLTPFKRDTLRSRYTDLFPKNVLQLVRKSAIGESAGHIVISEHDGAREAAGVEQIDGTTPPVHSVACEKSTVGRTITEPPHGHLPPASVLIESNEMDRDLPHAIAIEPAVKMDDCGGGNQDSKHNPGSETSHAANQTSAGDLTVAANDRRPGLDYWDDFEQSVVLMLENPKFVEDAEMIAAAAEGAPFISSDSWKGILPSSRGIYCFKRNGDHLGYWFQSLTQLLSLPHFKKETWKPTQSLLIVLQQCGRDVINTLSAYLRDLQQRLSPADMTAFRSCTLDAVEAWKNGTDKQLTLVRHLRVQHVAERNLALQMALKDEADEDVEQAALKTPLPSRQQAIHRSEIGKLRLEAVNLRNKRAFIANQLAAATAVTVSPRVSVDGVVGSHSCAPGPSSSGPYESFGPTEIVARNAGWECPLCFVNIVGEMHLWTSCGHSFCDTCSKKMFGGRRDAHCPLCRKRCHFRNVSRVVGGVNSKHDHSHTDPGCMIDASLSIVKVQGDWSIKIEAVVRRILALAKSAPSEKCLVFSQFPEALSLVSKALIANDIGYAQLTGGRVKVDKALNKFRDEDNVRVFLLSHRAGAQGLTLTRANHVILLEPALEPAIEQQAISRVHRVGQNRPVRVLRFLVQSSIEEEVLHIQEERHRAMLHEIRADPDDGLSNFVDQLVHKEVDVDAEAPTTVAAAVGAEAMLDADAQRLISAVLGV